MSTPVWLPREVVLAVHDSLLERFGGMAGVREMALLDSALDRPLQQLAYGEPPPSIFDLAAIYAHGIVRNHPFVDGNKRAGFMAAYVFLGANGFEVVASEEEVLEHTVALASAAIDATNYAAWLARSCKSATA